MFISMQTFVMSVAELEPVTVRFWISEAKDGQQDPQKINQSPFYITQMPAVCSVPYRCPSACSLNQFVLNWNKKNKLLQCLSVLYSDFIDIQ